MSERVCSEHTCCAECRAALDDPAPGDIVVLHSGGPDLTVLRVYSDVDRVDGRRVADLGWFTAAGEYRTGTLPLAVLRWRGVEAERPTGDAELHGAEAHPDFERVTFVGRAADPDIAPNTAAGDPPWMRNPHRHVARFPDRDVTYWMRRRMTTDNLTQLGESPQMAALRRTGRR